MQIFIPKILVSNVPQYFHEIDKLFLIKKIKMELAIHVVIFALDI